MDQNTLQDPLYYKRILLTVDGDDPKSNTRAFRFAVTLAHDYGAELGIVSVMENDDINIFDSLTPSKIKEKRDHLKQIVELYAHEAEKIVSKYVVDALEFEGGDVDDVIVEQVIPSFKPDLIVSGSDTQRSTIVGSIGTRLAKKAPVSVIVVR